MAVAGLLGLSENLLCLNQRLVSFAFAGYLLGNFRFVCYVLSSYNSGYSCLAQSGQMP
jgi:hypothetical protein